MVYLFVLFMHVYMRSPRVSRPMITKPVRVLVPYVHFDGRTGYHVVIRNRRVPINPMAR